MSISDEVINQIKETIDIVDLIGEYIPLKKVGKNFRARCPFHEDDTPSFYVSPENNYYHCFGCGVSGDIITFIREYEKVSFYDALKILAGKAGIELKEDWGENRVLYDIHKDAADFYHEKLLKTKKVLKYVEKRGINRDTIDEFKLGFAPSGSEYLKVAKKSFKIQDLLRSGVVKKSRGGIKDRFFLRLMFPIFSASGQIIGFGGRRLSKKGPKYLNSPDTPVHTKGKNLYSIWHTKNNIRKEKSIILVEGYFDFLSLYQSGIKNTVACMGTALTEDQAELLSRYADNIIIFFDMDAAGRAATLRSMGMLINKGVDVRIGNTGVRKDPDEIIKEDGVEEFKKLIDESRDFVDFTLKRINEDYNLSEPMGLSRALEEVTSLLNQIKDIKKYNIYRDFIAKKLNVEEGIIDLKRPVNPLSKHDEKIDLSEQLEFELSLIYAMSVKPEERDRVLTIVDPDLINNPHLKKSFRLMKEGEGCKIESIVESLPKNMVDYLMKESEKPEVSAISCALNLKRYYLSNKIYEKRQELRKIEEEGGDEENVLEELRDLINTLEEIKQEWQSGI